MGLGAQMILWEEDFCRALADRGHFVVRFDNRDVGLSTKLDAAGVPNVLELMQKVASGARPDVPYTLDDMADDTAGVLDALGLESAHVVGASMGGMIAQTIAILHPQRVRSLTSIMSSTGDPVAAAREARGDGRAARAAALGARRRDRAGRADVARDRQPGLPVRRGERAQARGARLRPLLPSRGHGAPARGDPRARQPRARGSRT